jgi:DNA-binding IclR family transcriptional regulator
MARPALSASRTVAVLNFLASNPTETFTLTDLSQRLGVNGASAHAVLAVLVDAGYLVRHPRLRTYTLGPAVVALGTAALESHPAVDIARDAARDLARETGLEVTVTAVAGEHIAFLARAGEPTGRAAPVHVGQRVPFVPPIGAVFAAWGDADRWLALSADPAPLRQALERIRAHGYSVALEAAARERLGHVLDEMAVDPSKARLHATVDALVAELGTRRYHVVDLEPATEYDVSMISAPVFDAAGQVVVSLTLLGFGKGMIGASVAEHAERLRDAASAATWRSHGRPPTEASAQLAAL